MIYEGRWKWNIREFRSSSTIPGPKNATNFCIHQATRVGRSRWFTKLVLNFLKFLTRNTVIFTLALLNSFRHLLPSTSFRNQEDMFDIFLSLSTDFHDDEELGFQIRVPLPELSICAVLESHSAEVKLVTGSLKRNKKPHAQTHTQFGPSRSEQLA